MPERHAAPFVLTARPYRYRTRVDVLKVTAREELEAAAEHADAQKSAAAEDAAAELVEEHVVAKEEPAPESHDRPELPRRMSFRPTNHGSPSGSTVLRGGAPICQEISDIDHAEHVRTIPVTSLT